MIGNALLRHALLLAVMLGTLLYFIGDVLLLAPASFRTRARPEGAPDYATLAGLPRRDKLYMTMAVMPYTRLRAGGLLGVFASPLTILAGLVIYLALAPAGPGWALPPALLYLAVVGPGVFVHGSFIVLGDLVHGLDRSDDAARALFIGILARFFRVFVICYAVLLSAAVLAYGMFSVAVALGLTSLPRWLAAVTPVTVTVVYILVARSRWGNAVLRYVEGSGFNVANLVFYGLLTWLLW